jgi:hypothetical protein
MAHRFAAAQNAGLDGLDARSDPGFVADVLSSMLFSPLFSTTVFSHASTVVFCGACSTVLCQPTGGKARLTEGCSFRRKVE